VDLLVRGLAAGIVGAILMLVIQKNSPEMATVMTLAVSALLLLFALQLAVGLREIVNIAAEAAGLSSALVSPVIKCVGVGIVSRFTSDFCKDCGAGSIASGVELMGMAAALYIALPLLSTLLTMIGGLI